MLDEQPGILVNSFTVILWEVAVCSLVVVTPMHFCCPGSALMVFLAALQQQTEENYGRMAKIGLQQIRHQQSDLWLFKKTKKNTGYSQLETPCAMSMDRLTRSGDLAVPDPIL